MSHEKRTWALVLTIGAAEVLAWMNRFVLDDAFISFRYARNLVEGHGLVYNLGERVEGFTDFLWTILMAVPHLLGIAPDSFAILLGLIFFPITLTVTYCTARAAGQPFLTGWLAILILGTNYTFSCFATGGLGTQMQTCLIVTVFWLLFRLDGKTTQGPIDLVWLSLASAAALLTRLDSAVMVTVTGMAAIWRILADPEAGNRKAVHLVALCVPAILIVAPWLAWKLHYYGDILPNTYYARVASSVSVQRGAAFVKLFFTEYWLVPALVPLLLAVPALVTSERRLAILGIALLLWLAYTIRVGGGFMEFRLLVPVMPLLALLISWSLVRLRLPVVRWALVAVILSGSVHHAVTFRWNRDLHLESIQVLRDHLTKEYWSDMGRCLARAFGNLPHCIIATAGAGAIAYYSGLPTVDLMGLNDKWIGKNGFVVSDHPGHQRRADLTYLRRRGVNFVLHGTDHVTGGNPGPKSFSPMDLWYIWDRMVLFSPNEVPRDSLIVSIPMDKKRSLLLWYLTRDPEIDRLIEKNHWKTFPVTSRPQTDGESHPTPRWVDPVIDPQNTSKNTPLNSIACESRSASLRTLEVGQKSA